jgi:hypothetical protein
MTDFHAAELFGREYRCLERPAGLRLTICRVALRRANH